MRPDASDLALLWDMWRAANDIVEFVEVESIETFREDRRIRYAVERQLLVIGEAARRLSPELREAHSDVPWRQVIGLRNVLAHAYGEILVERIWIVARKDVPELIEALERIAPSLPDMKSSNDAGGSTG